MKHLFFTITIIFAATKLFAQIPNGYYDAAQGLEGNALKAALHNIIDNHTENSYNDLWDILPETDEDPNNSNNFILLYTGRSINKSSTYPDWNREHVWAKSHGDFGETPPEGTDAHHLRPTDVSVNSDRGNLDFDNGGTQHSEATGCYYDSDSWEPRDEVKGDVARMMFYMVVRYEGDAGETDLELVNYVPTSGPLFGKLSTLREWHAQDPPDAFEIRRNNIVHDYQNNRNPFIDNPEWVECIWGTTCNTSVNDELSLLVSMFPNPVKDNVKILSNTLMSQINVFDICGKSILSKNDLNTKELNLNTENFVPGIYFIEILDVNYTKILKKLIRE